MARKSEGPRFYDSKNAYFANIKGERVRLCDGPENKANDKVAQEKYDKLIKVRSVEVDGDRSEVGAVLTAYLQNARTRILPPPLSPSTYEIHYRCIQDFVGFVIDGNTVGSMKYRDLKMEHINRWVASRKDEGRICGTKKTLVKWSDNHAHLQLRVLRTAFKWAATEGDVISESVFARRGKKTRLPSVDLSVKGVAILPEEHAALLAQARTRKRGDFPALLELLYHTGARPAEMYLTKAEEWNAKLQSFVIDPNDKDCVGRLKTRRHLKRKGRKRIIRIPEVILPVVQKLLAKYPEGYLIRRESGLSWADNPNKKTKRTKLIADRFASLVKATNSWSVKRGGGQVVRPDVTLYSYRHGFVTRWLKEGRKVMTLCELLNTSLEMIQSHYSHLFEEHQTLLDEVNEFSSGGAQRPQNAAS